MSHKTKINEHEKPIAPLQFLFLMIIYQRADYISVKEILQTIHAHLPEYEPSTGAIYNTLKELTERGLVEKEQIQKDDERIKHYRITNKGEKKLREIYLKRRRFLRFMEKCCAHHMKK
ncbi:MAG: PadR family transcriptional regulator [Candidatus Heimdallarchaeota archaeon]